MLQPQVWVLLLGSSGVEAQSSGYAMGRHPQRKMEKAAAPCQPPDGVTQLRGAALFSHHLDMHPWPLTLQAWYSVLSTL